VAAAAVLAAAAEAAAADAVADEAALETLEVSTEVAVGGKDWERRDESWVMVRDHVACHQVEEDLEDQWDQTDQDR
jgi:hypothetical protein